MAQPLLDSPSLPGWGRSPVAKPTVLVVDDDPWVGMMLEAVLQGQGCQVRLASGGQEALEVYRRHREAIDLVLLDVVMPGMGGCQTLAALRDINPGVRCCFM